MVNSEDILFIGTEYGLFRSTDNANSYEKTGWIGDVKGFPLKKPNDFLVEFAYNIPPGNVLCMRLVKKLIT